MRIRSEWVTLATVTGLAVCGFMLPRHPASGAAQAPANHDIAAAGIDYTPVGSAHSVDKKKILHHRQ